MDDKILIFRSFEELKNTDTFVSVGINNGSYRVPKSVTQIFW